jgi:hypothetical protein
MSEYNKEDMVTWEELAPSLQELFKTLQSQLNFFDKRLLGEIDRAKAAEKKIKDDGEDALAKKIQELFGITDGKKGQVMRTNKSGLKIYADDHLFLCQKDIGTNPNYCYAYDFEAGTYKSNTGATKELPWRSFFYNPKSQKLWWYEYPHEYVEVKKTFSSADEVTSGTGATGAMEVIDFKNDTYDSHIRYTKVYSNGFCEQGGMYAVKKSLAQDQGQFIDAYSRYVPLKIPYRDSKYIITLSQEFSYEPNSRGFDNQCICTLSSQPNRFVACIETSYDINYVGYRCEGFIDLLANGYNVT